LSFLARFYDRQAATLTYILLLLLLLWAIITSVYIYKTPSTASFAFCSSVFLSRETRKCNIIITLRACYYILCTSYIMYTPSMQSRLKPRPDFRAKGSRLRKTSTYIYIYTRNNLSFRMTRPVPHHSNIYYVVAYALQCIIASVYYTTLFHDL